MGTCQLMKFILNQLRLELLITTQHSLSFLYSVISFTVIPSLTKTFKSLSQQTLLSLTGSQDERVQEAAAGCIKNMRVNTINILAN